MARCPILVLICLTTNLALAAAPIHLAILPDTASAVAGDLLTAELSKNDQVILLERVQIEKIIQEQKLTAAGLSAENGLKLGQLLGADGVLTLDLSKEGTNTLLNTRLLAVKPGVILDLFQSPWPMDETAQWPQKVAARFSVLFPKLSVLPKDAIPISILNLRSAVNVNKMNQLEREMTLLLIDRLTLERAIFVLERRRLETLTLEKGLNKDASPFWGGSYLFEGTIDRDGFSPQTMTISARLSPPVGGPPTQIELSGQRGDLPGLVDSLVKKILTSLHQTNSAPDWKPAQEAERYYQEARWALRWKMFPTAQAASESAWALGKQDPASALIHVRSYLAAAEPRTGGYEEKGKLVDGKMQLYLAPRFPPAPDEIDTVLRAANNYHVSSQNLAAEDLNTNSEWCQMGNLILRDAGEVLQHYYFSPNAQPPVTDKLAELREQARQVADWLLQIPSIREIYWRPDSATGPPALSETYYRDHSLYQFLALWSRYWQESPGDQLAFSRKLMSGDGFQYLRPTLFDRDETNPILIGWNENDRRHADALWKKFIQELQSSPNPLFRLEGKYQEMKDADWPTTDRADAAAEALFARIMAHHDLLVTNRTPWFYTDELPQWVAEKCSRAEQRRFETNYHPKLKQLEAEFWNHLSGAPSAKIIRPTSKAPTQFSSAPRTAFQPVAGPGQPLNPPIHSPPVFNPPAPLPDLLEARRYLRFPAARLEAVKTDKLTVLARLYREGRVWQDLRWTDTEGGGVPKRGAAAASLDLATGNWDIVPYPNYNFYEPLSLVDLQDKPWGWQDVGNYFEIFHHEFYLSEAGGFRKFDLASRHWEKLPIPMQKNAQLFVANNRLFVTSDEAILELLDHGHRSRLLASCRRRPAATLLDNSLTLGWPSIFPGPGGSLRANVGGAIYTWDEKDWTLTSSSFSHDQKPDLLNQAVIFRSQPLHGPVNLWLLPYSGTNAELCFHQEPSDKQRWQNQTGHHPVVSPTWTMTGEDSLAGAAVAVTATNIYMFTPHTKIDSAASTPWHHGEIEKDGRQANLISWDRGFTWPKIVPLKFQPRIGPPITAGPAQSWLLLTPEFWVISQPSLAGVWTIPRPEVEAAFTREPRKNLEAEMEKPKPPAP